MSFSDSNKTEQTVFILTRASRCYGCDAKLAVGDLARLREGKDEQEVVCKTCSKLEALVMIPAGNAKITRAAKKQATTCYVILKWSELWKTYERQGLLIDQATANIIKSTGNN